MKQKFLLLLAFLFCLHFVNCVGTSKKSLEETIKTQKIWSNDKYNAFTSLIRYNGLFYCSFREGEKHVHGKDGLARIIISKDGTEWDSIALIEKQGFDLRDPKLSITSDGRLMVLMGGSIYEGKERKGMLPHVSFSDKSGKVFSEPQPINISTDIKTDFDWLWRVDWFNDTGYGVLYQTIGEDWALALLKTTDGINYDLITKLNITGKPNETTIRIMPDGEMLMMVRRESEDKNGFWGRSMPPYTDWQWTNLGFRIGGPDFIALNDSLIIAGSRVYKTEGNYTALFAGNRGDFKEILKLPSGGDTSYPGFVQYENKLWISYYSSHEGIASIYLTTIPLKELFQAIGTNNLNTK